jgi:methionine synthase II (cobalamin-independent)
MAFVPKCLSTTIGSLPHTDAKEATELMLAYTPRIPAWVQLAKRPQEGMLVQFSEGLPGFHRSTSGGGYFDTDSPAFQEDVSVFYENYLAVFEGQSAAHLESYALTPAYAEGFHTLLQVLKRGEHRPYALKGQVTGPFTFATSLTDQQRKSAYYNLQLRDIIVKMVSLKATWQIKKLKVFGTPVIMSLDEPSLVGFGSSAYLGVTAADIQKDLNEIISCIHQEHGYVSLHCCENTDWSMILATAIDILSFDAYSYFDKLLLYADSLRAFLARGGIMAWGLIPTGHPLQIRTENTETLLRAWHTCLERLSQRGIDPEQVIVQSLITPSCGAGLLSPEDSVRVLQLLRDVSQGLQNHYGN